MENKIVVGKITKPHGLKGEFKVVPLLNNSNIFKKFKNIFIDEKEFKITRCAIANKQIILALANINNVEQAKSLVEKYLEVEKKFVSLEEGEYFIADLIGCEILTFDHILIGKIFDIQNFGASDVVFIKNGNKQYSLPHIDGVFESVDLKYKKIKLSKFGEGVLCDEN